MKSKSLIIFTIMLVAILEVLDSTIVNVALPNMMPSLSANQDEITWVLTSYVVAAAMFLPLTGFLSQRLGIKNLLLIDITGFMITSFLCGSATALNQMVLYRLLQGAFGAALIPLSQAILRESFPLEEQSRAMAIWGLGIMAAPVFGPTLGGYIVAHASWRWIFYLNAPICFLGLLMTLWVIPKTPATPKKIDYAGIFFMFVAIGCLQLFLDQGNSHNWFSSNEILLLFSASIIGIILFLYRSFTHDTPVITLSIFKDRNFSVSTILLALFCGALFGFVTLQPIMLESLFHYTPLIAGKTMVSIGVASAIAMIIAAPLMQRISVKYILIASLLLSAIGIGYFSTLTLQATTSNFIIGDIFFGTGMGLFMVPLATYSLATLPSEQITEAAGLFSYGRMLGTSIGISLLSTLVSRETQINWTELGAHINVFNPNLRLWLAHQQLTLHSTKALTELQMEVANHASMIAFLDAYRLIFIVILAFIPLVLMLKNVRLNNSSTSVH